jgi:ribose transport system ATP-binding protein
MRALRARGLSILWVTHRLEELHGLADTITVLCDGMNVATVSDPESVTPEELVRLMVGGKAQTQRGVTGQSSTRPSRWTDAADEVLRLDNISNRALQNIHLSLKRGEVVGVAGIAGAGRTELARAIIGADRIAEGSVYLRGQKVNNRSPRQAYQAGIALVPEERKTQGILGDFSISKNITIASLGKVTSSGLLLDRKRENAAGVGYVKELGIRTPSADQKISKLSGGNQQKTVIARCLFTEPTVLIFDEPTQGIDVAAKSEVYRLIFDFVDAGGAVILISSELPELLRVADRIVVMREGRVAGEVSMADGDQSMESNDQKTEEIMALAVTGGVL